MDEAKNLVAFLMEMLQSNPGRPEVHKSNELLSQKLTHQGPFDTHGIMGVLSVC